MVTRLNYTSFYVRLLVFLLPLGAFAVAGYLRFWAELSLFAALPTDLEPYPYFGLLLVATILWAVAVEHYGIPRLEWMCSPQIQVSSAAAAVVVTYVGLMVVVFLYRDITFSRIFVPLSALVLFLMLLGAAVLVRLQVRWRGADAASLRVLVIGADDFAGRTAEMLCSQAVPCSIVGFVRIPGQVATATGRIYEVDEAEQLAVGHQVDDAVIAVLPAHWAELHDVLKKLEPLCIPIRGLLNFGDGIVARETIFHFGNLVMVDLRTTPAESLGYLVTKRAFDIGFSVLVLTVLSPLMLSIAVVVRLTSAGPVLFRQMRVGLNGKLFCMYKFRTMRVVDSEESDTRWTTPGDDRCTGVGRLLRRTSLDELPQFLNVFKGDMSVVGPRPERPHFVQKFLKEVAQYNTRHYLKVGITGWAQVNGWRGNTCITKRVEYDLYYLQNWSLLLDLKIVWLTIFRGLVNRNAY